MAATFDQELEFDAPTGGVLDAVRVEFILNPPTGSAVIHTVLHDGTLVQTVVRGAYTVMDIPLAEPRASVEYRDGLKSLKARTVGWKDGRR